jgi:hypothetical protein
MKERVNGRADRLCGTPISSITDKVRYHPRGSAGQVVSGTAVKKAGTFYSEESLSRGAARLDNA